MALAKVLVEEQQHMPIKASGAGDDLCARLNPTALQIIFLTSCYAVIALALARAG
jgi:hypothetical protein